MNGHEGIWVLCDGVGGEAPELAFELLGAGRALAAKRGQKLCAVLMGDGVRGQAATLCRQGADGVIVVDDPALKDFNEEDRAAVLLRLVRRHRPEILLVGASPEGRALAPRLAILAHCGLTADCTGLDIDPESGALLQTRPAFGGTLMATIRSDGFFPQMASVRPGVMKALAPDPAAPVTIFDEPFLAADRQGLKRIVATIQAPAGECLGGNAQVVVAGGRGMRGPDGFALLRRLAALLGGAVGASRAAVDAGWAAYGLQVGQTGKTVQPKVYIACGISGQIQHLVGMQSSDLILAINPDKQAPIMKLADLAVVGDAFAVIPRLIELIERKA